MTVVSIEIPEFPQSVSSTLTGVPNAVGRLFPSSAVMAAILNRSFPPRSITRNPR